MSHTVYLFNIYSLIEECYYQTTLPPPLSLFERIVQAMILLVRPLKRRLQGCAHRDPVPKDRVREDSFST